MARIADFLSQTRPDTAKVQVGIGSFTALVRTREGYKLTAEVPTTPVEDGTFVQDHIILKPLTLSISGNVSDIHRRESPLIRDLKRAQANIGNLTSRYAPSRTQAQLSKVNALINTPVDALRKIDSAIDSGEQALKFFGNKDAQSKTNRQLFENEMRTLYNARSVISIFMGYETFERMVITSISFDYDNETDATEFSLEAQQIRYADLKLVKITRPAAGLNGQTKLKAAKGAQEGKPVVKSFITNLSEYVQGKI